MIWKEGYESGELRSIVYDDVPSAFERWANEGKTIAIYSSGSVLAQKLLFGYTNHSDLTPHISHYFDTEVGHKRDDGSYEKIADELKFEPNQILFLSDIPEELSAASAAGMDVRMVVRPGNAETRSSTFPVITSFDEIP